ncbi:MAG TPA: MFS transporter [Solirubrobacteraceae bacterium]|nr:MFS transporter [Solirubrobacteraceae bacterium]
MTTLAAEPEAGSGYFARYRRVLARRDVRRLFGALVISATGSWAYNTVLLAYVFERTHSLGWVGAAGIVRFVPQLVFSTYGGVLAERLERIRLMVTSDIISAVWQAGLAVVAATGAPAIAALVLAALAAITGVVYQPATAATIPSLVDEDDLAAANALNGTIDQLVVIVGPGIGALLLVAGSTTAGFSLNAASFLISALLVGSIRTRSRPVDVTEGGSAGLLHQLSVGFRTILALRAARVLVAYCALVTFVYGTDTVLFMGVSVHHLGTGTHGFAYLLAGLGVGGVLLAAAVDRMAGSSRLALIIIVGALGYSLPTALLIVIHSPVLAFLLEVFRGGSTLIVDVLAITSLQRAVEPDKLARVFGVFFAIALAAVTLGALVTPIVVHAVGLDGALWVMSLGPAAVALAGMPALLRIDRETVGRARQLAPRVALLEGLGLFAGASRPILERLAGAAESVTFEPGATIVREGDPADAVYVLAEGEVSVSARGESGADERPIRDMQAPTFFGEIGVLEGIPRTASVTALTPCRCERIDGDMLLDALLASPPSTSLMEQARSRLAITHPSRRLVYEPPVGAADPS